PKRAPKLINVYAQRSFRFSFTNEHMARVVLEFLRDHPEVWPANDPPTAPPVLHTLTWRDDGYSRDLALRFQEVFHEGLFKGPPTDPNLLAYSTGDAYTPNPPEVRAVGLFFRMNPDLQSGRHLLVLPTSTQRAQRLLRTLVRRHPAKARNLVVATGDSIGFNSVYRDRNVSWNVQDVPVPLLFFAHRNPAWRRAEEAAPPVGAAAGVAAGAPSPWASLGLLPEREPGRRYAPKPPGPATDDLLLHRDILEAVVQAAFRDLRLLADADVLRDR